MPRSPRAEDLYVLRVPTDVRVSPDGSRVCFVVKEPSPDKDEYRSAIWLAPADGSAAPRKITLGSKHDSAPRWSPDGTTLAFLSDRGDVLRSGGGADQARDPGRQAGKTSDDATQVWLLPMDGGEARQLTRLPASVGELAWSPDGTRLCVTSWATSAVKPRRVREPGTPPDGDAHLIDRLQYMSNGEGYTFEKAPKLWVIDVADGSAKRITSGPASDEQPTWSPDGKRIAFVSQRHPDRDLTWRYDVYVVDSDGGPVTRVTGGRGDRSFRTPSWSPDGRWIATAGHRYPAGNGSRNDVWRFRADGGDVGQNLSGDSDLMVGAGLGSDLFGFGEPRLFWSRDADWILFNAPFEGAYELWAVHTSNCEVRRLTKGEHAVTRPDAVFLDDGLRVATVDYSGTETPDLRTYDVSFEADRSGGHGHTHHHNAGKRLSSLMADAWREVDVVPPVSRWHEVDGRRIQGWFLEAPRRNGAPAPLVLQIHGGPATLYGWSMFWEWQVLVAAGISVYACNPRGSQGYGQDFCYANYRDWGDGPMRDVMGGVDALIDDGLVDGDRLGVTGGSYGGYLTSWIVGHTDRFKAAVTCRSVNDMTSEMLSGDIAGPNFGDYEYGVNPWEDPVLYWQHSPIAYAVNIHTPLLIQHAEKDLRCPITQGEELFTVLRSLKREVRFMRVPEESHELTRSGAPFRRVENINRIRDWFVHYLVEGKTGLPPV
jgi:dipeptidyl aminopeptidase/acylaminoacyl peptidase